MIISTSCNNYISTFQGFSKMGLSPGQNLVHYANKCMKHRMYCQRKSSLPSSKRRRLQLKQECSTNQGAMESLEGVSYQSGIFVFSVQPLLCVCLFPYLFSIIKNKISFYQIVYDY